MRPLLSGSIRSQRGATIVELMIALVVLALGLLAVSQLFPAGSRGQVQDRLMSSASYYAQEQVERLATMTWAEPQMALGRHPAGTAVDSLGPRGTWQRFHTVDALAAPLDNLRKVTVTVNWRFLGGQRQVTVTTYVRR